MKVAKETGYNLIHFSPIQELGGSNSCYSIKDHHKFNHTFSNDEVQLDDAMLTAFVEKMRVEWDMLSVVDVVWNHTAHNTEWIKEHPEAAYNIRNMPHLRPAYLVDRALWHFSNEVSKGKWIDHGIPPRIDADQQLGPINKVIWYVINSLAHSIGLLENGLNASFDLHSVIFDKFKFHVEVQ